MTVDRDDRSQDGNDVILFAMYRERGKEKTESVCIYARTARSRVRTPMKRTTTKKSSKKSRNVNMHKPR